MISLLGLVGSEWGAPLTELSLAVAYAFGFVLVVLGRTELFTDTRRSPSFPSSTGRRHSGI